MNDYQFTAPQEDPKPSKVRLKPVLIALGAVVLCALALWGGWAWRSSHSSVARIEDGTLYKAPAGKAIDTFPPELLQDGAITESYRIDYDSSAKQSVLSYSSAKPLSEDIAHYRDYLASHGWVVTHEADPAAPVPYFYARKDNDALNITFAPQLGAVEITIAYTSGV